MFTTGRSEMNKRNLVNFRKVVVGIPRDGCYWWEPREFEQLKKGDVFYFADDESMTFEADGDPVPVDPPGNFTIVAHEIKDAAVET